MKLILLGAPGAGKGTQAETICAYFHIPAISTGNIIRESIKNETELGAKTKPYLDSGALVPDDLVIALAKERLSKDDCQNGFILDGFPRTVGQAQALDEMGIVIDTVLDIEVADEVIVKRLSGRRVCASCGATYHLAYNPPKAEGVCDKCGDGLILRKDDHPDTVQERLRIYHDSTEPLKDYYAKTGKLVIVEGQEEIADTSALVLAALGAK